MAEGAEGTACARCDAEGQTGNFCTSCGYDLRPPEPAVLTPRHRDAPEPPAVVTCGACGALNAKSRSLCARCRSPLREGVAPPPPPAPPPSPQEFGPAVRATAPPSRSSLAFRAGLGLTALALVAVTGTLLAARRGEPAQQPREQAMSALAVERVLSSTHAGEDVAARVTDGDPGTAWTEGKAGPGVGEWVELRLPRRARVARLTVWNGDQRGARFLARNRVRELRIDAGGSRFTVELLDIQGAQVVELPRAVRTDRLRLTVASVHGATPDADTSLSELELYGAAPA